MVPAAVIVQLTLSVAYLPFALALAWTDVREHRLPNRIVLRLSVALAVLGALLAAALPAAREGILFALVIALVGGAIAITVSFLSPTLLGMGDAKTLPAVLFTATAFGGEVLIGALLAIAVLGGLVGAVVILRSGSGRTRFPYGPVLLLGPFAGLCLAPLVRAALGTA